MKKNLILIASLIVILFVLGFIFKKSNPKEVIKEEGNMTETASLVVADSFSTKALDLENSYVKFEVKYPYFIAANSDFNLNVENLLKDRMIEHLKISTENWQARFDTQVAGDNIPEVPSTDEEKFSFIAEFTIVQSNASYISYVLTYGGFSGGAHGYENKISFAYDVKNQKNIGLKDIFLNNPEYLTYISSLSRELLKNQFATISEEDKKNSDPEAIKQYVDGIISTIEAGTDPKEENFNVFTFTPDKIKIYFAQYQVGPYSIGMPEVEIDR